jgi:hypothetical protein
MAQDSELTRLEERRLVLLARSEQYRQHLGTQLDGLSPTVLWVERGYSVFQSVRSFWPIAATATGFLFARKGGSIFRNTGRILSLYRLAQRLFGLWKAYRLNAKSANEKARG